jgi:hypothetical protein
MAPAWSSLGNTATGTAGFNQSSGKKDDGSGRRRYEFVVLLVWREPGVKNVQAAAP